MEISAIILAAGKGTRMKSELPKCAHIIIDKPMVEYVVDSLREVKIQNVITIIGYGKEKIKELLQNKNVKFAVQEEQLGTAHAVMQAQPLLEDKDGITIIAIGDMPFIKRETFYALIINHIQECADLTVLTVEHPQPHGYGRIIRDDNGQVLAIVEERDCTKEQASIREINSSVYAVDNQKLFKYINKIKRENDQNEYYLTDLVKVFNENGLKVSGYKTSNFYELSGINNKLQLAEMEQEYQKKIIETHLLNGVTIHNPQTVSIGKDVKIAPGVEIHSNTLILGKTVLEEDVIVGPCSQIRDCIVKRGATISNSIVNNSIIEENSVVGPFQKIEGLSKNN